MEIGTAGNQIIEPVNCDCGLTGGCEKCNIVLSKTDSFIGMLTDKEAKKARKKLKEFKKRFDKSFNKIKICSS